MDTSSDRQHHFHTISHSHKEETKEKCWFIHFVQSETRKERWRIYRTNSLGE